MDLRELRLSKGLTQRELGEAVGINRISVYQIEIGDFVPSFRTADKLAAFFNVPVEKLFPKYWRASPYPQKENQNENE